MPGGVPRGTQVPLPLETMRSAGVSHVEHSALRLEEGRRRSTWTTTQPSSTRIRRCSTWNTKHSRAKSQELSWMHLLGVGGGTPRTTNRGRAVVLARNPGRRRLPRWPPSSVTGRGHHWSRVTTRVSSRAEAPLPPAVWAGGARPPLSSAAALTFSTPVAAFLGSRPVSPSRSRTLQSAAVPSRRVPPD